MGNDQVICCSCLFGRGTIARPAFFDTQEVFSAFITEGGIEMLDENETRELLGNERFDRLLAGRWISPFIKGFERPMFRADLVELRLQEDLRRPGGPAVEQSAAVASCVRAARNCVISGQKRLREMQELRATIKKYLTRK
jgi:hypothetical protein